MSHKQSKKERKMAETPPQQLPPIQHQLVINYHQNGQVTFQFPTNMKLTGVMLGQAIQGILEMCEFKAPSPIVQVPPGARLQG